MDINTRIYDRIVDHLTDVRQYEEGVQLQNRRIFQRHRKRLRDLLQQNIRADVQPEVTRFGRELLSHQRNSILEFSTSQLDFHSDNFNKELRNFYRVTRPKTRELLAEITGPNIRGANSLPDNIRNISSGELVRIQTKVKAGLARNASPNEIIEDVLRTTRLTENQARTLTRTAITSTQTAALNKVVESNAEVIKGYIFTAILDSRTSPICSFHNGKVYDINDNKFKPPLHWNCRSSLIPLVKSKEELLKIKSNKINKTNLNKVQPERLAGQAPAVESFGAWLFRQSFDIQSKILGSMEKANLFREGKLRYDQFVTQAGKGISIQALRNRASNATSVFTPRQKIRETDISIEAARPSTLLRSPRYKDEVRQLFLLDADDFTKTMSLTDFRGTSLAGKTESRRRVGNEFDERNFSADPLTGEIKNNNLYDPDFNLYQERIDFMRNSKLLSTEEKDFIESVAASLDDRVSVNQQTVIIENLRVIFERYSRDKKPWDNLVSVIRAENRFAVQNVSRLLDTRSRQKSEMFVSYLSSGKPQVQIMGRYYDFEDLVDGLLVDQRFIDNWRSTEGLKLASNIYLRGRAPARVYFRKLVDKYPSRKKLIAQLKKDTGFKRAYEAYKKLFNREPTDSWIVRTYAKNREAIRRILDLEFLNQKQRPESKFFDDKAIDSLTKIMKLVASGQSTDYDALAINIGKQFSKDFDNIIPFTKNTLADYHAEGSRILRTLEEQNLIRVQFRGKTRRGVIDLDTGRASGGWADTISREVIVIDKNLLKLQEAERRVTIARRLGTVNERDRLYVKAGSKTYFDARGNDTGIPLISRDKFPDYDEKQIDREMAEMLNHVMSVEYSVDPLFFTFMDDIARFRDPRGNSKYYDSINEFRHEILNRGEQGYGLLATAKYHAQRGRNFRTTAFIDSRGRVYHRGYLTPTGGELVRPFLNSGRAINMSVEALDELQIQIGALIGPGTEALTQAGRRAIFRRNRDKIIELGEIMLATTQRDRRLREFLEHPLIRNLEGAEVPKMARLALEYARINRHVGGDFTTGVNKTIFGEAHNIANVLKVQKRIEEFKPEVVYHEFWEEPETIAWAKANNFILKPGDLSYKQKDALIKKYGGATEQFHRDREAFMYKQIKSADPSVRNAFLFGNDHIFDKGSVIAKDTTLRKVNANGKVYESSLNKLSTYKTKLMIENDASSSGAQIIGLSTGDRAVSQASNVLATRQKNRLYDLVAMDTVNDPEFLKIPALRDANLTWEDLAKAAKSQNMVSFYGAGQATKTANVANKLSKVLDDKGFITITKDNLNANLRIVDGKIKVAERLGATTVVEELTNFRKELIELINKNEPVGRTLLKQAQDIHPDVGDFVEKLTNARRGIIGPKEFSEISRIMSKNLAQRAPVTDNFINYWKEVATVFVNETKKVDIPWVTFDGKIMTQRYRPKIQERIEFRDPVTNRRIANIYEASAEDGKLLGKGSLNDARIGLGVNGNHSNDAVIVRRFHLWGRKNNVQTATIHDAFFTNIGEARRAKDALRTIYADALEGDTIRKTLAEMRRQGLSYSSYIRLLNEAKRLGLIDPPNKITRKDILAEILDGQDWYGIGP